MLAIVLWKKHWEQNAQLEENAHVGCIASAQFTLSLQGSLQTGVLSQRHEPER